MTSTVRFFLAILNCVKALTGFDDTKNKFHNLFKCFSVGSISRALTSLNPILPTTPAFQVKIADFYQKRDKIAAVTPPPLANLTGAQKLVDFSDSSDDGDDSHRTKRAKIQQPVAEEPVPPPPPRETRQSRTSPPSANQQPANLTQAPKRPLGGPGSKKVSF